jgi:hypothetical protein
VLPSRRVRLCAQDSRNARGLLYLAAVSTTGASKNTVMGRFDIDLSLVRSSYGVRCGMMVAMLWGYAISGIVGIVGTSLGAWLTGRWQTTNLRLSLNAESQRAELAEKRQIYASFHSAYHNYTTISTSSIDIKGEPGRTLYNQALTALLDITDQLSVTAPTSVSRLAMELTKAITEYAAARKLDRDTTMIDHDAIYPDQLDPVRTKLIKAMRKDLGIDS